MADLVVTRHTTPESFLERAGDWLGEAEDDNALMLGICCYLIAHPERVSRKPYLATVERGESIAMAAVQTPPHNVVLARSHDPDAVEAIAKDLHEKEIALPGVVGPADQVAIFACAWARLTGADPRSGMAQGLYVLTEVTHPSYSPGRLRCAVAEDRELVTDWGGEFAVEANVQTVDEGRLAIRAPLDDGAVYLWEDGGAVSMAVAANPTPHGIRISWVYTPPLNRSRGYATSCVAALSQGMLDSGRAFCCLYTDLGNATSTRIYQRIGYRHLRDWDQLLFG